MDPYPGMRIGELARRLGVTTDVLRVWERRHGLFNPDRSAGGYRLYTLADERRAQRVLALRARGVPVAQAVAQVLETPGTATPGAPAGTSLAADLADRLDRAVEAFDAVAAVAVFDEALDVLGLVSTLCDLVMDHLRRLGDRWAAGELSVAHEHFASHVLRQAIGAQGVEHRSGDRPSALLACPPGERHDIALLALGVLLSRSGWVVRFLGADTPVAAIVRAGNALQPDLVILAATRRTVLLAPAGMLQRIGSRWSLAIGGSGTDAALAARLGATLLPTDLRETVGAVEQLVPSRPPGFAAAE